MKLTHLLGGVLLAALSSSLFAAERNTFYLGGAFGALTHDAEASLEYDGEQDALGNSETFRFKESSSSALNYSLIAGFNVFSWLSTELHYNISPSNKWMGDELELETQTVGLFGVYQKGDDLYFRLRMGLAQRSVEFSSVPAFGTQEELTGAMGFGLGQVLPVGSVELMYTYYPKMKIESDELKAASEANGGYSPEGIVFSDRMNTQTWSIAYLYTF